MQNDQKLGKINIVLWAESSQNAEKLLEKILPGSTQTKKGEWSLKHEDQSIILNGYTRWPKCLAEVSPQGFTDILIGFIEKEDSPHLNDFKIYKEARKGIPYIYLTSDEDLSTWAKDHKVEFIKQSEVTNDTTHKHFIKQAVKLNTTLQDVFSKIDTENEGFIKKSEIIDLSKSLDHELNEQDAVEIMNTLSCGEGKISFDNFKSWWLMGRTDFNTFRRLVEMELSMNKLVKKSSEIYNTYLENLNKETLDFTDISKNINNTSRIGIHPIQEFQSEMGMSLHATLGKEFDSILETLPDYFNSSPLTYVIEIKIKNPDFGSVVVDNMQKVKNMISEMRPEFANLLNLGLTVDFRHVGHSIFIDVSFDGLLADKVGASYNDINLSKFSFSGTTNGHFYSSLKLTDLFELKLEELINKALLFKIESMSEVIQVKELSQLLYEFMVNYMGQNPALVNALPNYRIILQFLKLIGSIKDLRYDFKYDSQAVKKTLFDILNIQFDVPNEYCNGSTFKEGHPLNVLFTNMQGLGLNNIINKKPIYDQILGPYNEVLKQVNFDSISFANSIPKLRIYYQYNLNLPGLTDFLNTHFIK